MTVTAMVCCWLLLSSGQDEGEGQGACCCHHRDKGEGDGALSVVLVVWTREREGERRVVAVVRKKGRWGCDLIVAFLSLRRPMCENESAPETWVGGHDDAVAIEFLRTA